MELWEGCEWDAGAQQFKAFQGSFPTDDGDFLKQVKLTGRLPETLCPASLREGNLTEGGDDGAEPPATLHTPGNSAACSASDTSADVHMKCKLYKDVKGL